MFASSEAFEKWQDENPEAQISVIQPVITGFNMAQTEITKTEATSDCKVFVTYYRHKD